MGAVIPRILIIAGYSYSGASAVVDYLKDYAGVSTFPGGEMRVFGSANGLIRVIRREEKGKRISRRIAAEVGDFLDGRGPQVTGYDRYVVASVSRIKEVLGSDYSKIVELTVEKISNERLNGNIAHICQEFIRECCRLYAEKTGATTVILDQAVRPHTLDRLKLFRGATMIICRRDFRDQHIERVRHGIVDPEFYDVMLTRSRKVASVHENAFGNDIFEVWFEDLVTRRSTRVEILKRIGINNNELCGKSFNAIASRRNLSLYKKRPDLLPKNQIDKSLLYVKRSSRLSSAIDYVLDYLEFSSLARSNAAGAIGSTQRLEDLAP